MGGDRHVQAEPQEVAAIGFLVLVAIWDDADTAHRQHGLQEDTGGSELTTPGPLRPISVPNSIRPLQLVHSLLPWVITAPTKRPQLLSWPSVMVPLALWYELLLLFAR
jgi:hypothetical protein